MDQQDFDLDHDGKVSEKEMKIMTARLRTQRRIAVVALVLMSAIGMYIAFWMPVERMEALGSLLDFFWITMGGIIATYMGSEAWMSSKKGDY